MMRKQQQRERRLTAAPGRLQEEAVGVAQQQQLVVVVVVVSGRLLGAWMTRMRCRMRCGRGWRHSNAPLDAAALLGAFISSVCSSSSCSVQLQHAQQQRTRKPIAAFGCQAAVRCTAAEQQQQQAAASGLLLGLG